MLEAAKKYIEDTPAQIVAQYVNDTELHGMRTQEAQAKLQKMIYAYGQTVANILRAEAAQGK